MAYWILVLLDRPCVQSSDLHQGGGTVGISFDITCCAGDSDFRRGIQYTGVDLTRVVERTRVNAGKLEG